MSSYQKILSFWKQRDKSNKTTKQEEGEESSPKEKHKDNAKAQNDSPTNTVQSPPSKSDELLKSKSEPSNGKRKHRKRSKSRGKDRLKLDNNRPAYNFADSSDEEATNKATPEKTDKRVSRSSSRRKLEKHKGEKKERITRAITLHDLEYKRKCVINIIYNFCS